MARRTWPLLDCLQAILAFGMRRSTAYRASFVLDTLGALAVAATSIAFWQVLYDNGARPPGLSQGDLFLFFAYVEVFFAVTNSCFATAGKLWRIIHSGRLDTFLIRPASARVLMVATNIRLDYALRALPSIGLFLWLAALSGEFPSLPGFLGGLILSGAAALCFALLQLAGSWLAFFVGRSEFIDELTDSLVEFMAYPHTIFPLWVQGLLMFVLPFGYAATGATDFARGTHWAVPLVAVTVSLALWGIVQQYLWQKGLCHYDSPS